MAVTVAELTWICGLLEELNCLVPIHVALYFDNQAAIRIASNPIFHERTKYIEIDCHFVREKIKSGLVQSHFISTTSQLADVLTKSLGTKQHQSLVSKLGLFNVFELTSLRGCID